MKELTRRQFLTVSGTALGAGLVAALTSGCGDGRIPNGTPVIIEGNVNVDLKQVNPDILCSAQPDEEFIVKANNGFRSDGTHVDIPFSRVTSLAPTGTTPCAGKTGHVYDNQIKPLK